LKAWQEMKLYLNASETNHLYKILKALHRITESGIPQDDLQLTVVDESEAVVVTGRAAELVRQLTEEASDEFWDAIQELQLMNCLAVLNIFS
jgi:hypothetical protein